MLNELAAQVYADNKAKGFWDDRKNIGEMLMLVTSELAEALEADRKGRKADVLRLKSLEFEDDKSYTWENSPVTYQEAFKGVKDSFEDEIADAIIRLMDLSGGLGIDIDFHVRHKLAYNRARPFKHGKKY